MQLPVIHRLCRQSKLPTFQRLYYTKKSCVYTTYMDTVEDVLSDERGQ